MVAKIELVEQPTEVMLVCDRCGRVDDDILEMQEYLRLNDVAGYGNVTFGDLTRLKLDLCQYCVKDVLGEWVRTSESLTDDDVIAALSDQQRGIVDP